MSADLVKCPGCGSERTRYREHRNDWFRHDCDRRCIADAADATATDSQKPLPFVSDACRDAGALADRLKNGLEARGYRVWLDRRQIVAGSGLMGRVQAWR